jgi:hypothetical protein
VGEDGRSIFRDVLVDQDSCLSIAQQQRQLSLAVEERKLAIILDQVEGVQHRALCGFLTAQLVEA